jgi:carbon-monoxide dehydrogenase large subunit/6-hydroxypseudooxynicotine dehydrogenase subunit gamma
MRHLRAGRFAFSKAEYMLLLDVIIPMAETNQRVIGASVPRLEDEPLVRGEGSFVGDISFPHQLHMRVVRSVHAHGRILSIDTDEARRLEGVIAIWTIDDIADLPPIEFREGPNERLAPYRQPVLARDIVRYSGEPVAVVFAEDPYVAEDAADMVVVDIDELPVAVDACAPAQQFSESLSTEATICRQGYGDVDAAFHGADAVVAIDVSIGRHSGMPLETRGAIGRYDAGRNVLELHGAAKVPHKNREALARMFGISTAALHLYESHVGGGFGIRGELYPEDVLVLVAAKRFRRPVKWIEDRREHMVAANQSREQHHRARAAVAKDGFVTAIDDEFFHNQGAYIRTHGTRVVDTACGILPGPYRLPNYRVNAHFRLTNKTPAATYRAPGRYETNFVRERLMDAIAAKLGLSRIEVRRRNLLSATDMPYARPLTALGDDIVLDSGDYAGLLDKALARFEWDRRDRDAQARRAAGEHVGLGLCIYVEKSGLGPTDGVNINVDSSGAVEVVTGGASLGQGFETVIAQICAEVLGVNYRKIRVVHGRTDRIERGIGAHATRATVMTGNATAVAAANLRNKALEVAAKLLQAEAAELSIGNGIITRIGNPAGPSISLGEVSRQLRPVSSTGAGRAPGLTAEGWFNTAHMTYPYGVQLAQVKLDNETGGVTVEKFLIAFDVGRAVNPMLVKGQLVGGFAQGLGGALYEEFLYDDRGQPLCGTLADYLIPTACEIPDVDVMILEDAPSGTNPLGIKGAGEGGIAGVGAVIASAVDDALAMPGAIAELPITPRRIRELMASRDGGKPRNAGGLNQ